MIDDQQLWSMINYDDQNYDNDVDRDGDMVLQVKGDVDAHDDDDDDDELMGW